MRKKLTKKIEKVRERKKMMLKKITSSFLYQSKINNFLNTADSSKKNVGRIITGSNISMSVIYANIM